MRPPATALETRCKMMELAKCKIDKNILTLWFRDSDNTNMPDADDDTRESKSALSGAPMCKKTVVCLYDSTVVVTNEDMAGENMPKSEKDVEKRRLPLAALAMPRMLKDPEDAMPKGYDKVLTVLANDQSIRLYYGDDMYSVLALLKSIGGYQVHV